MAWAGYGARFQLLFTAGSMVGGVNGAVIGVFFGVAVARFGGAPLLWATAVGVAVFAVAAWLHMRKQRALFEAPGDPSGGSTVSPSD